MEYEFNLTVPADTAKASPAPLTCKLTKGIVHQYALSFPFGCNCKVYLAIDDGGHQAFPLNRDEGFSANGYTILKGTFYPIETEPFELRLRGWSPGTTYQHIITVRFDILSRERLEPTSPVVSMLESIKKWIGL